MKPGDYEYLKKYSRLFFLGHLYFTHIRGTQLETAGWTGEKLARYLEAQGLIFIYRLTCGDLERPGVKVEVSKFAWLPGKEIKRAELVSHIMKRKVA